MIEGKIVYINEYIQIDPNGKYKVTLQGSLHYNFGIDEWQYEIKKIEPCIPLKYIYSKVAL